MDHKKQTWSAAVTFVVCFFVIVPASIAISFTLDSMVLPFIIFAVAVASLAYVLPLLTEDAGEPSEGSLADSDETTETEQDIPPRYQPSVRLPVADDPGAPLNVPSRQWADCLQPSAAAEPVRPPTGYDEQKELSQECPPSIQPQALTSPLRDAPDLYETDAKRSEPGRVWDAFAPHLIEMYVRPPTHKISNTMIDMHDFELATLSSLDSTESDEGGLVCETSVVPDLKAETAEAWGASAPHFTDMYVRRTIPDVSDTMVDMHDIELATLSSLDSCEGYEAGLVSATSVDKDIQCNDEVSVYVEMSRTPTRRLSAELSPSRQYDFKSDGGCIELSPLPALFARDA